MENSKQSAPQSVRMLDEAHRRDDAQKHAEAELAFDFEKAIEDGDPDATPGWTGSVPDYKEAERLGIKLGSPLFPRRKITVAGALSEALDYQTGPGMGDVVRVLSLALRCSDPIVSLSARQLLRRAASKFAEHNVREVDE